MVTGSVADLREVADDVGAGKPSSRSTARSPTSSGSTSRVWRCASPMTRPSRFGEDDVAGGRAETEGEYLARLLRRLGVSADAMRRL